MKTIDYGNLKEMNIKASYGYCENIAKQKNPFLYHVSRFFKDQNKFKAFCSTYASMRVFDDLVDGIHNRNHIDSNEKVFI